MKPKRLFVAIPLPDTVKVKIHTWIHQLQLKLPFRKWVHQDDLHLTLKYLGETEEEKMEQLQDCLMDATKHIEPFTLVLKGLGTFGPPAAPSILWAGIHGNQAALHRLQQSVETSLESQGFERELRPFHPHITLARQYIGGTKLNLAALSDCAQLSALQDLSWQADRIVLYESQLGKQPMYKEIRIASFMK